MTSSLLQPSNVSGNSTNPEKKRYSRKTLLYLRKSKFSNIKPENFNEPDYGKFDLAHTREGSGDRNSLQSAANFRGRERREVPGERSERGKRSAQSTFFKTGSFDQRSEESSTTWDNKRKNEKTTEQTRKGNQRTASDGPAPAPTEKKKRDTWTMGSLTSSDELTREEQARREEFEKFRKQHQHSSASEKSGTADAILEQQPSNNDQVQQQPSGQMFMSSDFFSNLTIGEDELDPLAHFNPNMMMSNRKTSSLLFGESESGADSLERESDILRDLKLDDKLGADMDAPFNPEQMFADILGMDQSNSMPPTPTHMFNAVPEGIFFKPPNMPHPSEMADLASIEGEFLPKGATVNMNNQQQNTQFDINNLFMQAPNLVYMQPPPETHIMPQHLLNNQSPYMHIPYHPQQNFPPQPQQFVDPYQEYMLVQQREQQKLQQQQSQQQSQQQKVHKAQPQPPQQQSSPQTNTNTPSKQEKGKIKRNMVPPQLQKQLGKTITDKSPAKKKEEEKKKITQQKSPQNLTVQTRQQQQVVPPTQQQQQGFSPLHKWFGPNLGAGEPVNIPQHHQQQQQQNFMMPQNAMSLEEIEAALVSRK